MLERLILGDTLNYSTTVTGYSAADGWVLKYALVPRAGATASITLTSAADGAAHRVQETAVTTAAWTPGVYSWHSSVEKASEKYSVASGSIELVANPRAATTGPLDLRTEAQIALDNVRAVIRGKASADVLRYQVQGRSLERYPMSELVALESKLAAEVEREQEALRLNAGLASKRKIYMRMGRG